MIVKVLAVVRFLVYFVVFLNFGIRFRPMFLLGNAALLRTGVI